MGKNMEISAYQINNALRVYGKQLRRGRISNWQRSTHTNAPDKINISARDRQETDIDDITSSILEQIPQFGPHNDVDKEVLK
jgi:hypothetical protein